jgi:hypothetical protein
MHLKAEAILEFGESDEHQNKIIRAYRDEYKQLNSILGKQPKILELAHRDLQQLSKATSRRGRKPTFTSENLFRAILVMQREGLDYREASIRIAESDTLQNFCRLLKKRAIFTGQRTPNCSGIPTAWQPERCPMDENTILSAVPGDSMSRRSRSCICILCDTPRVGTRSVSARSASR